VTENKKIALLGLLAFIIVGGSLLLGLSPRQLRDLRPYLLMGAGFLLFLFFLVIMVKLLQRHSKSRQAQATQEAVANGESWMLLRPKEAKTVDVAKVTLWRRLAYAQPTAEHFSFEAHGNADHQRLLVHATPTKLRSVLREFIQEWDDVQRRPVGGDSGEPDWTVIPEGWSLYWLEVGPSSTDQPVTVSGRDPLLAALSELADIPAPTRAMLQVIARSDTRTRHRLGTQSAQMRTGDVSDPGVRYQRTHEAKRLEERGARLFLEAVVRVAAVSPNAERARGAAVALANTLCNQFGPDNPVVILAQCGASRRSVSLPTRAFDGAMRPWADDEIAALAHLPGGNALSVAPMLATGSAKALPARPELRLPERAFTAAYASRI